MHRSAIVLGLAALLATSTAESMPKATSSLRIVLRAEMGPGQRVSGPVFSRAAEVLRARLTALGVRATVTQRQRTRLLVLNLVDAASANGLAAVWMPGVLELYDLEADLAAPSMDTNGLPVGSARRPSQLPHTAVATCSSNEAVCPGEGVGGLVPPPPAGSIYYYLFRRDPAKGIPELTRGDLDLAKTRQDVDPLTNEPLVWFQFTSAGRSKFRELTRDEWRRDRLRDTPQHFAIVLDGEIRSFPQIDYTDTSLSKGIDPIDGAEITGLASAKEAKVLAVVLRTGPIPLRLIRAA